MNFKMFYIKIIMKIVNMYNYTYNARGLLGIKL